MYELFVASCCAKSVHRLCVWTSFWFVILLDRLMGWTEEKRNAVFQDFQGHLSRFYTDGRKKPSISEFINIAVHLSVISLAGSNLTNTHQYPIIMWDIISSIIKLPHQVWNHWEARAVLVRELGFVYSESHTQWSTVLICTAFFECYALNQGSQTQINLEPLLVLLSQKRATSPIKCYKKVYLFLKLNLSFHY